MQAVQILGFRRSQTLPALLGDIARDRDAGRRVFVLVPEQYTLQAERELLSGLRVPGLLDLDVLSPRRLERLIEDQAGRPALPRMTDAGRAMAFAQAIMDCEGDLQCYHRAAERAGLPDRLSALVGDLEKALMTPEELREIAAQTESESLRLKLNDILRVWEACRERIAGRFADPLAAEEDLRTRLGRSGLMRGASLYVCGFDTLQSSLMSLLTEAAAQAFRVCVALTMDQPSAPDARVFLTQRMTAQELQRRLAEAGIPCQWTWIRDGAEERADSAPAIRHLEKHLFARDGQPLPGSGDAVCLHTAADPYAEAAACAAQLTRWHRQGLAWEQMAVAFAAPDDSLMGVLDATLEAAQIPHYMSRKDAAMRHGLVRLLVSAVRAVCGGWQQEDLLSFVKSGFAPLSPEESQVLENYVLENGITRNRWRKPFTRGKDPEGAEALRLRIAEPLERLQTRLRESRSAAASVEALYQLLVETDAYRRLGQREEELLREGLSAQASQNRQVWRLLLGLMDQMAVLLDGRRAAMRELPRLLEAGLNGAAIAALPPKPDAVMAGTAGHVLTGQIRALAVLGLQDGVTAAGAESLLSDTERGLLSQGARRSIGLMRAEQSALRQADFYRTLTLPSRYLYLSCSAADQQGTALRPSILLGDISRLLPDAPVTGGVHRASNEPLSPQTALEEAAPRLRAALEAGTEPDEETLENMRQLLNHPRWAAQARRVIAALRAENRAGPLPPRQAERLYRSERVSVSRLEDYAQCPYRGFITRGLRPVPRRDWGFEADEQGSFFHQVLERYTSLAAANSRWPGLSEEEENALFEEAVQPFREEWVNSPLDDDPLSRRVGEEIVRTVHSAARMFTAHAHRSGFSSSRAEVSFGRGKSLPPLILLLPDGTRTALEGTIDRIDWWQGGGERFVSVVDHKSGDLRLEKERIWYGLQLQLLIYLKAASQADPALPGGAFYFRIEDPLIEDEQGLAEAAGKGLAKRMRLKGVVLSDVRVVDAMNSGEFDVIDSPFGSGNVPLKSKLSCSLEEMRHLMDYAAQKAAELTQEMRSGLIDLAPVEIGGSSACKGCLLSTHCPLDEQLPGTGRRRLEAEDKEELWRKMTGKSEARTP